MTGIEDSLSKVNSRRDSRQHAIADRRTNSFRLLLAACALICVGLACCYKAPPHSVTLMWEVPLPVPGVWVVGYNVYQSTTSQWAIRDNGLPSSLAHRMKIVCWAVAALLLRRDYLNWVRPNQSSSLQQELIKKSVPIKPY